MAGSIRRRVNYLQAAFLNAYNITALAGVSVTALATHQPWVMAAGVAAEAFWMLLAPNNPRFKRAVDTQGLAGERLDLLRRMQEQAALLPTEDRQKVQALATRAAEMKAECLRNPKLQGDFMKSQLDRLDGLVAEYIHLAITAHKCETYLNRADTKQIGRERETWRKAEETAQDRMTRQLAEQNGAILDKRLALINEMGSFSGRARAQMSLIQNTIALLRDQVMTMATPEALTVELDELVTSVEAIKDATHEIEAVVGAPAVTQTLETAVGPEGTREASAQQSPTRVR